MDSAKQKYLEHKSNAQQRNIDFELSFEQWYDIWTTSGHWQDRGVGRDKYVMSRLGDKGPYSVQNVFIQLCSDNIREYSIKPKLSVTKDRMKQAKLGTHQTLISCVSCRKQLSINNRFRHWTVCE